jgi:DNA-binding NarL/FixJ family response regulator
MKTKNNSNYSLLIIDDDPQNLMVLEAMLIKASYNVSTASLGNEGLDLFNNKKFNLILLDIGLPDMDGFEILNKIRNINAEIPVIFITAHRDENTIAKAFECGINDFISKPFLLTEVMQRVKQQLIIFEYRHKLKETIVKRTNELNKKKSALGEFFSHFEEEKKNIKGIVSDNINYLLAEPMRKLKLELFAGRTQKALKYAEILENNINHFSAPFADKFIKLKYLLSSQEYQICEFTRNGMRSKEIGIMLNITESTVKWHKKNICDKLKLNKQNIKLKTYLKQL